jgi:hypothetical protein
MEMSGRLHALIVLSQGKEHKVRDWVGLMIITKNPTPARNYARFSSLHAVVSLTELYQFILN